VFHLQYYNTGSSARDVEKGKDFNKRKSIFKKKKKTLSAESPHGSREPSPLPDEPSGHTLAIEKKKSPQILKKSFRKVAKVVKIGRSISKDKDKSRRSIDEVDGEMTSSGQSSTPALESSREEVTAENNEPSEVTTSPKRPDNIPLKEPNKEAATTPVNSIQTPQSGLQYVLYCVVH